MKYIFQVLGVNKRFLFPYLIFTFLLLPIITKAQGQHIDLTKSIKIPESNIRLRSLFKEISDQSVAVFSYDSRKINDNRVIKLKPGVIKLSDLLRTIETQTGLNYRIIGNHIILNKKKIVSSQPSGVSVPDSIRIKEKSQPVEIENKPTTSSGSDSLINAKQPDNLSSDTIISETEKVNTKILSATDTIIKDQNAQKELHTSASKASNKNTVKPLGTPNKLRNSKPSRESFAYLNTGLILDETLFPGVLFNVGVPYFFGSVSWNTNFNLSYLRYGAGVSIKIGNKSKFYLTANTGNLNKKFLLVDTVFTGEKIIVKSVLTKAGFGFEYNLTNHILLQIESCFNYMHTSYLIRSVPDAVGPYHNNADEYFSVLRSPYYLKNTYSFSTSSNTKQWIGFQVGLLYRFNLF